MGLGTRQATPLGCQVVPKYHRLKCSYMILLLLISYYCPTPSPPPQILFLGTTLHLCYSCFHQSVVPVEWPGDEWHFAYIPNYICIYSIISQFKSIVETCISCEKPITNTTSRWSQTYESWFCVVQVWNSYFCPSKLSNPQHGKNGHTHAEMWIHLDDFHWLNGHTHTQKCESIWMTFIDFKDLNTYTQWDHFDDGGCMTLSAVG